MRKVGSMKFSLAVAALLLVGALLFPMTTSLGQGVEEASVTGWTGVYEPDQHVYVLRILHSDGSSADDPMQALPASAFTRHGDNGTMLTDIDAIPAIAAAYAANAQRLEEDLGTHSNVASFAHPFSHIAVAYTPAFLRALAARGINPDKFGGPNVPPGSVPYNKLRSGLLQVDTAADGNIIRQCLPGEIPPELAAIHPSIHS